MVLWLSRTVHSTKAAALLALFSCTVYLECKLPPNVLRPVHSNRRQGSASFVGIRFPRACKGSDPRILTIIYELPPSSYLLVVYLSPQYVSHKVASRPAYLILLMLSVPATSTVTSYREYNRHASMSLLDD